MHIKGIIHFPSLVHKYVYNHCPTFLLSTQKKISNRIINHLCSTNSVFQSKVDRFLFRCIHLLDKQNIQPTFTEIITFKLLENNPLQNEIPPKALSQSDRTSVKEQIDKTISFENSLKIWAADQSCKSFEGDKTKAADKIRKAYYNRSSRLNLENLLLGSLPEAIGELSFLKVLDLSGNRLHRSSLPSSFTKLTSLKRLSFSFNKYFRSIPPSIFEIKTLTHLDFSGNKITDCPQELEKLSQLKGLDLSSNAIENFPSSLLTLKKLTHLNLNYNELIELPEDIDALSCLEELKLSENYLTDLFLPDTLGNLSQLKDLDLSSNMIEDLPDSVGNLGKLEDLNISGNTNLAFFPETMQMLSKLKVLSTESTKVPDHIVSDLWKRIEKRSK